MTEFTIRRATLDDTQGVVDLWRAAAIWLRDRGSDQWQYPVKMHNVDAAIVAQTCWMVENTDGTPAGTVTVDKNADPDLWHAADLPEAALYAHRLVVREDLRGQELGAAILDWASARAKMCGKVWLRLDAWTTNAGLQHYYLKRGFQLVRVVRRADIVSGALFQRPAGVVSGLGPSISES